MNIEIELTTKYIRNNETELYSNTLTYYYYDLKL